MKETLPSTATYDVINLTYKRYPLTSFIINMHITFCFQDAYQSYVGMRYIRGRSDIWVFCSETSLFVLSSYYSIHFDFHCSSISDSPRMPWCEQRFYATLLNCTKATFCLFICICSLLKKDFHHTGCMRSKDAGYSWLDLGKKTTSPTTSWLSLGKHCGSRLIDSSFEYIILLLLSLT